MRVRSGASGTAIAGRRRGPPGGWAFPSFPRLWCQLMLPAARRRSRENPSELQPVKCALGKTNPFDVLGFFSQCEKTRGLAHALIRDRQLRTASTGRNRSNRSKWPRSSGGRKCRKSTGPAGNRSNGSNWLEWLWGAVATACAPTRLGVVRHRRGPRRDPRRRRSRNSFLPGNTHTRDGMILSGQFPPHSIGAQVHCQGTRLRAMVHSIMSDACNRCHSSCLFLLASCALYETLAEHASVHSATLGVHVCMLVPPRRYFGRCPPGGASRAAGGLIVLGVTLAVPRPRLGYSRPSKSCPVRTRGTELSSSGTSSAGR